MSEDERSAEAPRERPRPLWNVISIAVPLMVLAVGVAQVSGMQFGTGDYGGRLGSAVLLILALGLACAIGFLAALISLVRGERWSGLSWLGLIGNGAVVVPILNLAFQD